MSFKKSLARVSTAALAAFFTVFFAACNVSDPEEHHEEELITSVRLVYAHAASGSSDTVWFRDTDGPGGVAPTEHDTIRLFPGRGYSVALSLLNESNPADVEDITAEVRDEGTDHQVFYTVAGTGLSVAYADQDDNGLPLGLSTTQTTTTGSPGAMTVTLKHQPGLKTGSSTITTGETDVAVTFVVVMYDISMPE